MPTKRQRERKDKARRHRPARPPETSVTKKRHHFVPQLHLRGFAQDDAVWTVPLADRPPFPQNIRKAAFINHFYRLEGPSETAAVLEDWFANAIEGPAATALAQLESGQFPPALHNRFLIARFMAAQILRTPRTRAAIQDFASFSVQLQVLNAHSELGYEPYWSEAAEFQWRVTVGPDEHALAIVDQLEMLAAYLFSLHWSRVVFQWCPLLTTDNPVVMWRDGVKDDPFGIGIATADEFWFAVSRRCALGMAADPIRAPELDLAPTRKLSKMINQLLANGAWDWIFHHPNDYPLEGVILPPPRRPYHALPDMQGLRKLLDEAQAGAPPGYTPALRQVTPAWIGKPLWEQIEREMGSGRAKENNNWKDD